MGDPYDGSWQGKYHLSGQTNPYGPGQAYQEPLPPVQNYLVFAVLATLFCCLPLGVVAILFATQVNTKLAQGDYFGAVKASNNARNFCLISAGVQAVIYLITIIIYVAYAIFAYGIISDLTETI